MAWHRCSESSAGHYFWVPLVSLLHSGRAQVPLWEALGADLGNPELGENASVALRTRARPLTGIHVPPVGPQSPPKPTICHSIGRQFATKPTNLVCAKNLRCTFLQRMRPHVRSFPSPRVFGTTACYQGPCGSLVGHFKYRTPPLPDVHAFAAHVSTHAFPSLAVGPWVYSPLLFRLMTGFGRLC